MKIARTPTPNPNSKSQPRVLSPSVLPSPKPKVGIEGTRARRCYLPAAGRTQTCPSAVPRMWRLQLPPGWGQAWGPLFLPPKKEGSRSGVQPQPGLPPLPPCTPLASRARPAVETVSGARAPGATPCPGLARGCCGAWGPGPGAGDGRMMGLGEGAPSWAGDGWREGGCALFTLGAVSRLGCGAGGCDVPPPLPAFGAPLRAFLPKPAPPALAALQTHVSKAVPVLDLAAILRDGRQPLLVLHEIAGGLALLEPFGVAFGQGGRGEEQQRQHQPPAARGAHRGQGPTWGKGGLDFCSILVSFFPPRGWRSKRRSLPPPSSCGLTPVTD